MTGQWHFALVQFTFPFHLGMESASFDFTYDGLQCLVRVRCAYAARKYEFVPEAAREKSVEHKFYTSIVKTPGRKDAHARTIMLAQRGDMYVAEVTDTVGYTRLDVFFQRNGGPPVNEAEQNVLRREGLLRVQHFIRHYRMSTMDHFVGVPVEDDSFSDTVAVSTDCQMVDGDLRGHFTPLSDQLRWERVERTGINKLLSHQEQVRLQQALAEGLPLLLHNELMQEAAELSHLHGDHKLAVVISETAFETFVQWRIAEECRLRGISSLSDRQGTVRVVSAALEIGDLKRDLLGEYAQQLAGQSVKAGSEYQRWDTCTYAPRNEIVHKGRTAVSADQAKVAVQAAVAYTAMLGKLFESGRSQGPSAITPLPPTLQQRIGRLLMQVASRLAQRRRKLPKR